MSYDKGEEFVFEQLVLRHKVKSALLTESEQNGVGERKVIAGDYIALTVVGDI